MTSINHAFINALLADSAYVDGLSSSMSSPDLYNILKSRMTPSLANFISKNFSVVSQASGYASNFDAVVWRGVSGTPYENQVYVSMRGTQEDPDKVADVYLYFKGLPYKQLVDMVNWWLRETAPPGDLVRQLRMQSSGEAIVSETVVWAAERIQATGRLNGVTITGVNGHSLGGYLATAFARLFGNQQPPLQITTFNSAGFSKDDKADIEKAFSLMSALIDVNLGLTDFPDTDVNKNFYAANGINVTTNDWNTLGFQQYGERIPLFQEESGLLKTDANHSMYKITDYLALGDMLAKLDQHLDIPKLNSGARRFHARCACDIWRCFRQWSGSEICLA